jgi:hypothetical protein
MNMNPPITMRTKSEKLIDRVILGIMAINTLTYGVLTYVNKYSDLKEGYVSPRDISIRCKDIDYDGKLETIIKINDKPYLLMIKDEKPGLYDFTPRKNTLIIGRQR